MDKMQQLARDVERLEKRLDICTRCGVCQGACPLYDVTRNEADVSRGKLALITGLIDGLFKDAKGVKERLDRCLLCGSCAKGCPSGVDTIRIVLEARSIISQYLGLSLKEKTLFKSVLSDPERFNKLAGMAASFQKFLFKEKGNLQGTSCARLASPLLRGRQIVPLAETSFFSRIQQIKFKAKADGVKISVFAGCVIDKVFPSVGLDMVKILDHLGAAVSIPENQACCGIPALSAGDMKTFEHLVETNLDLFSENEPDYLVTACATCTSTIVKLWPAFFSDKSIVNRAEKLAERTVDISWLLTRRFGIKPVGQPEKNGKEKPDVTYHDPCHLKKSLDISKEPRNIIRSAGHRLVEMTDPDACCGMGGSFNFKHYDLSKAIGTKKAENIIKTGCPVVATSCPACMMQLSDMLAGQNAKVLVKHPVELLAEQLNL